MISRWSDPAFRRSQASLAVAVGAASGLLSGLMGVGGGVVAIPAMTMLLGIPQHRAHGTSLAMVVIIAPVSALAYALQGNVDWRRAVVIAVAMSIGAVLGARVMMRIPARQLRRGFALVLLLTGLRMFWS